VLDHNLIRHSRVGMLAATAVLLAACGGSGATTAPTTAAGTEAPPSTAPASEAPAAPESAEGYEVELADSDKYGQFLTGEDGKTLYLFTPDTTSASNCNDQCAANWPPFTLDSDETVTGGDGVTGAFATIARADGSMQVTYAGHPLYYFGGDKAAGDTNGEGLNDKWYLVGADGNAIMGAKTGSKGTY